MIALGYAQASAPSAQKIVEASDGRIHAIRSSWGIDVNWGRRVAPGAALNPDISRAVNKRLARETFERCGVPAPRLFTSDEARAAVEQGITVLGRPDSHTRHQGFWICTSQVQIDTALRGRGRKRPATHFMEWLDVDREFRVHVLAGKSIRISEKLFDPDGRDYTTIKPTISARRHIRDAAKSAVEALGLDFGAVDVLADDERAFVLEVNTGPGLGGSTPKLWADAFVDHLEGREV